MPGWLSLALSLVAKIVTQWLANREAEKAFRDLGAKTQAEDSRREAERQEAKAQAAADAAAAVAEDPNDPFLRKDGT